jgi:hemerythrin-like metal-binding protein
MAFYEWKESFCTHVGPVDDQRRRFVTLLNELHEIVEMKWDRVCMDSLLSDFIRNARVHFEDEEKLLESVGYPHTHQHMLENEFFLKQLREFKIRNEAGDPSLGSSALQFLRDWFLDHIIVEDQKYAMFLFGHRTIIGERRRSLPGSFPG